MPSFDTRLANQNGMADPLTLISKGKPSLYWYPGSGDDLTPLVFDHSTNPTGERLLRLVDDQPVGTIVLWMNDYLDTFRGFPSLNEHVYAHADFWTHLQATVEIVETVYQYVISTRSETMPYIPLSVFRAKVADQHANQPQRAEGDEYLVLFSAVESEQLLRDVFVAHGLRTRVVQLNRQGGFSCQRQHFFTGDTFDQYSHIPQLISENEGSVGVPDAYILDRDDIDIPGYEPSDLQTPYPGYSTQLWRRIQQDPDDGQGQPYYGHSAEDGLNVLKDVWNQKRFLQEQCDYLADHLGEAIENTEVPQRGDRGFRLDRPQNDDLDDHSRERLWEQAIWRKWTRAEHGPVAGCWHRIISYQIPLFDQIQRNRWGHIDLLGITNDGTPVVIELKKDPTGGSTETPLRMVLEASAYAVAVRAAWQDFRHELLARLHELEVEPEIIDRVPEERPNVSLLCLAPDSYWLPWLPVTARGRTVTPQAWNAFRRLCDSFGEHGMTVAFATVAGRPDLNRHDQLSVRRLHGFPLG